jgi:nucleoside-diphosphate-sugar epimerase
MGRSLAADLARQGHEVFGLRRSAGAESELAAAGVRLVVADMTNPADLAKLPGPFDWVVNCASASGGGVEEYRRTYLEGNRNLVAALAGTALKKFVYTSSTGVYGQNDGALVKETHPTEPATETGQVLVEAEKVLLEVQQQRGFPAVVLRVAGIYGPGRGHYLKEFMKNRRA